MRGGQVGALPHVAEECSQTERRAADAERELVEWKKVRFMADKLGESFGGYVTGVQSFGLFVELEQIYVQGLVHVSSMTDDYYIHDERAHTLRGENAGRVYRLGDKVRVQVARVDLEGRQIDFALLDVLERSAATARRGEGGARRRRTGGAGGRRGSGRSRGSPARGRKR
jgi:ribonuclease R